MVKIMGFFENSGGGKVAEDNYILSSIKTMCKMCGITHHSNTSGLVVSRNDDEPGVYIVDNVYSIRSEDGRSIEFDTYSDVVRIRIFVSGVVAHDDRINDKIILYISDSFIDDIMWYRNMLGVCKYEFLEVFNRYLQHTMFSSIKSITRTCTSIDVNMDLLVRGNDITIDDTIFEYIERVGYNKIYKIKNIKQYLLDNFNEIMKYQDTNS